MNTTLGRGKWCQHAPKVNRITRVVFLIKYNHNLNISPVLYFRLFCHGINLLEEQTTLTVEDDWNILVWPKSLRFSWFICMSRIVMEKFYCFPFNISSLDILVLWNHVKLWMIIFWKKFRSFHVYSIFHTLNLNRQLHWLHINQSCFQASHISHMFNWFD